MTQPGHPVVAAVDWGTSSLRVWLLDAGGAVLSERRSDQGMQVARDKGFQPILERLLAEMAAAPDLPVIVCGMAGARQGWIEAPYADVPTEVDAILTGAIRVPGLARDVRIVPGVAQRRVEAPDVMRGEETQLAGALERLGDGRHVACMPGTHSKWVELDAGRVTGFATFMTGELFSVLSAQTILKHSIGEAKPVDASRPAFADGLRDGLAEVRAFPAWLFGIRASTLLFDLKPEDAAARLSGYLLGVEIGAQRRRDGDAARTVALIASGGLRTLYGAALRAAGHQVTMVDADEAVRVGLFRAARRNHMVSAGAAR